MSEWKTELTKLLERDSSGVIFDDFTSIGMKALPELRKLNELSTDDFRKYKKLVKERNKLTREYYLKSIR